MRRRTLFVALAGLAVVVAAGVVVLWPQPSSRITRENFERIKEGMSREEVEAILGPPCDFSTGPLVRVRANRPPNPFSVENFDPITVIGSGDNREELLVWKIDRQLISINFGPSGRVEDLWMHDVARVNQTAFENLLWRLKRQWRRWFPE
jgi:hypothetical protein